MLNALEVTGQVRSHVQQKEDPRFAAHPLAVEAFMDMRGAAAKQGFDLLPFSSFRDFKTQLRIWNHKYSGKKPLYDQVGRPRDFSTLSQDQIISHILDWSALPGGSRHQWGSEIDVVNGAVLPSDYKPKLLPEEVKTGGIYHDLHLWLDENIAIFGFFRPYKRYQGGMFAEPWHLSFAPVSEQAIQNLSIDLLAQVLADANLLGKERVLERLPQLFADHILNYVKPDEQ